MIGISTKTANIDGAMLFPEEPTETELLTARVSRSKTLDGSAKIIHAGYAEGDRTIRVISKMTEAKWEQLKTIFKTELLINLATIDGFYTAAITSIKPSGPNAEIKIIIEDTF